MLTLDKIYHAAFVLKNVVRKTDLIHAPNIKEGSNIYLKTENLQVTGSFKVRGSYYKISQLTEEEKANGVIACSAGNHAKGVALAAATENIATDRKALPIPSSRPPACGAGRTPGTWSCHGRRACRRGRPAAPRPWRAGARHAPHVPRRARAPFLA